MTIGDIFKLAVVTNVANADDPVVFTHHYRVYAELGGPSAAALAQGLAIGWQDSCQAQYLDLLSESNTLASVQVRGVTEPTAGYDLPINEPGVYSNAGAALISARSTVVVAMKSGLIGRRYNGRFNLPAPGEVAWETTGWDAGYISLVEDYTDVFSPIETLIGGSVVGFEVGTWSKTYEIFSRTISVIVRDNSGTQRRRQGSL